MLTCINRYGNIKLGKGKIEMKRLYFRKWVDVVLGLIEVMLLLLLGSEVDNTFIFVISKLIFMALFILNGYLLLKYSRIVDAE